MATVALPFSLESARTVLRWGASISPPHSHAEIANWCERFWNTFADIDAPPEIERILPVLADVECQWDMYLASELAKRPNTPESAVQAPSEWFVKWEAELDV